MVSSPSNSEIRGEINEEGSGIGSQRSLWALRFCVNFLLLEEAGHCLRYGWGGSVESLRKENT